MIFEGLPQRLGREVEQNFQQKITASPKKALPERLYWRPPKYHCKISFAKGTVAPCKPFTF
jgi:hypothetical protein